MNRKRSCLLVCSIISVYCLGPIFFAQAQDQQKPAVAPSMPTFKASPNDLITPPQIAADGKVTFKQFAPEANSVNIRGEWLNYPEVVKGTSLQRGDDGLCSTAIAIKPGATLICGREAFYAGTWSQPLPLAVVWS
jgi:hypothetical protein